MSGALGSWVDGVRADRVPADDRALHYGDGLFETVLVRQRRPRFIERHLARLQAGCLRLGIPLEDSVVREEVAMACAQAPTLAVLKIIVTRGSALRRGYAPQGSERSRRLVSLWDAAPLAASMEQGVSVVLASGTLGENPGLAGLKHLSRLENVLAAREAQAAGAFDALMRGPDGRLICGSFTNVFALRGRDLLTPAVDLAGVAGVVRGVLLRDARALGLTAREAVLRPEDLPRADGVFLTNARIGVVPVRRVGEHDCRMSDVTTQLARHIEALDA